MEQYEYKDYKEYRAAQIRANNAKLGKVWANRETFGKIKNHHGDAESILCHGARNGKELRFFKEQYPNAKIIGTDIADTANMFENMVEWDFHNVNEEWLNSFDIVYTNSFDHCFDPEKALTTWLGQLKENGKIYIELQLGNKKSKDTDPLLILPEEVISLTEKIGDVNISSFNSNGMNPYSKIPEKARTIVIRKNQRTSHGIL